jgi:hypothetical protein
VGTGKGINEGTEHWEAMVLIPTDGHLRMSKLTYLCIGEIPHPSVKVGAFMWDPLGRSRDLKCQNPSLSLMLCQGTSCIRLQTQNGHMQPTAMLASAWTGEHGCIQGPNTSPRQLCISEGIGYVSNMVKCHIRG